MRRSSSLAALVAGAVARSRARCICRRSIACCRRAPTHLPRRLRRASTRGAAIETVHFMSAVLAACGKSWLRPLDRFHPRASDRGGFAGTSGRGPRSASRRFENTGQGWEQERGTLAIDASPSGSCSSRASRIALALCINSFSTPAGGVVLRVVDVGAGTAPPITTARTSRARSSSARARRPALDAGRARARRGRCGVERSRALHPAGGNAERAAVGQHPVRRRPALVCVQGDAACGAPPARGARGRPTFACTSTSPRGFIADPNRTLIAEIPGASRAAERVVLVAHVQEPGANDNASGSGTLLSAALAIARRVAQRPRCRVRRARSPSCGSTKSAAASGGSRTTRSRPRRLSR